MKDANYFDPACDAASCLSADRERVPNTSMLPGSEKGPRRRGEHAETRGAVCAPDAWSEGLRNAIRSHPLASIAAALTLGLVIARCAPHRSQEAI